MKLQTVRASQGALWVRQGFGVLGKRPMAFAVLFIVFYAAFALVGMLPFIGLFIALASLPLRSLGFMLAARQTLAGRTPTALVFVEPLRGPRASVLAIVQLSALYAIGVFLIFWLGNRFDGGALEAFWTTAWSTGITPEALESKWTDPDLQNGLLFRLALLGLLSLPFWHAPALALWGGHGAVKALFFSCVACWRNKAAFAVYGTTWFSLSVVLGLIASILSVMLDQSLAVNVAFMAASFILVTAFFASLYFTYADCFTADPEPGAIADSVSAQRTNS